MCGRILRLFNHELVVSGCNVMVYYKSQRDSSGLKKFDGSLLKVLHKDIANQNVYLINCTDPETCYYTSCTVRFVTLYERYGSLCERYGSLCERYGSFCERYGSLCERYGTLCERNGSLLARYALLKIAARFVNGLRALLMR